MALHYDTRDCKLDDVHDVTVEAMIWATMVIDVGEFTIKNVDDVYDRLRIYEGLYGPLCTYSDGKSVLADKDLITKFVGLRTNVINVSLSKWMGKIAKRRKQEW